jgi:Tfp pilus assembly protein PilV
VRADECQVDSPARRAPASPLRDESGFGLIEVLVSAVIVVLVSLGVYAGIDGASATSGINKHRSIATEVAQQDQDRMRAMTVTELSNYTATNTSTIGGVTYTIVSTAKWVTDSTGTANCTSGAAQANYLAISSSVTWPGQTIQPITVQSVIAPPNGSFGSGQGSLAVQVRDRNGNGVPGATATLSGPKAYTDVTNANGCVLWGYLPVGNYNVAVAKTGYVDPSGAPAPTKPVGIVGESTTTLAFDYDQGGQIQASYQSWNGTTTVPANGTSFLATNPNLTVALPAFGDGSAHTSFLTGLVYPFTVGYSLYAGNCAGADPTLYSQSAQTATVLPGAIANVNLREPPINLTVINSNNTPQAVSGATVKLTGTASGCGALPARTTGSTGLLTDTSFPYGTYTFCVQSGTVKQTKTTTSATTLSNTTPTGIAAASATVDMKTASTGTCP